MISHIRLSPQQAAMLADRLGLPDCVCDGLEGWAPLDDARRAAIERRCRALELATLSGTIDVSTLDELDRLILADAHDGSTWFAMQEAELVDSRDNLALARIKATVCAVRRKLAAAGIKVGEPVLW